MSELKIKPLADRIVIQAMEAEETTKGGIILPDTAKEKPVEGTIVAAGPGKISDDGKKIELEVNCCLNKRCVGKNFLNHTLYFFLWECISKYSKYVGVL